LQFLFISLIQTLITFKQKIVKDFRRRHWIRHEKIFQKRLKENFFIYNLLALWYMYKGGAFFLHLLYLQLQVLYPLVLQGGEGGEGLTPF